MNKHRFPTISLGQVIGVIVRGLSLFSCGIFLLTFVVAGLPVTKCIVAVIASIFLLIGFCSFSDTFSKL